MPEDDFRRAVLPWVQERYPRATEVLAVEALTDDMGGTEHGFYSEAAVSIRYTNDSGVPWTLDVRAEDVESLWRFVMRAWPEGKPDA